MTLDEFISKWIGKKIENDGKYPYQCVDLTKQYSQDVIGTPPLMGNAKEYATNPLPKYYQYHDNPLWYIPPRGAIAIWGADEGGGDGHVGVVTSANIMNFESFDQNWPPGAPATIVKHTYRHVIGFLIPIPANTASRYNELIDQLRALATKYPKV